MTFDRVRNAQEIRQLADYTITAAIACLAAGVFATSLSIAFIVALFIFRPYAKNEIPLYRKVPVWLAVLTLCLLSLGNNWSAYKAGVSSGYNAIVQKS